jgi:tRNA A37 methylthiotransferase MiaB
VPEEIEARRARVADLADELISQRAASRIGEQVQVLIEEMGEEIVGRAIHQGPEVDGAVRLIADGHLERGALVGAVVCDSVGVDLIARHSCRSADDPPAELGSP